MLLPETSDVCVLSSFCPQVQGHGLIKVTAVRWLSQDRQPASHIQAPWEMITFSRLLCKPGFRAEMVCSGSLHSPWPTWPPAHVLWLRNLVPPPGPSGLIPLRSIRQIFWMLRREQGDVNKKIMSRKNKSTAKISCWDPVTSFFLFLKSELTASKTGYFLKPAVIRWLIGEKRTQAVSPKEVEVKIRLEAVAFLRIVPTSRWGSELRASRSPYNRLKVLFKFLIL